MLKLISLISLSGEMAPKTISKKVGSHTSRKNLLRRMCFAILFFLLNAFFSTVVIAQTEISSEEFMEYVSMLSSQLNESTKNKDYQTAEKLINETFALLNRMSQENQNNVNWLQPDLYYLRACYLSMQNKVEAAVNDFEKAVEYGYTNYSQAKMETDLDNIRTDNRFIVLLESIREKGDFVHILRQSGKYQSADTTGLPRFTYEKATSNNLRNVKQFFQLDDIAGEGDEISKILNLMKWVHDNIRHNGSNYALCEFTSIDLFNYHKSTGKGINCRHLAIVLNEIYLAMGIKSRYVTCGPKDNSDVHVINSVYSTTLNKWLWMDPTMNAYWKDENDNLLSIEEVRQRLIDDLPLVLNEDANRNNETQQTRASYLDGWLAKHLYWFSIPVNSGFNTESRYRNTDQTYVLLIPLGYEPEDARVRTITTYDASYFWEY